MKLRDKLLIILTIIILSGIGGYFIRAYFEKPKPNTIVPAPTIYPTQKDSTEFKNQLAQKDSMVLFWKQRFIQASLYPNINFLPTHKDSSFVQSHPDKSDSLKLSHCSDDLNKSVLVIQYQDSVNQMLTRREIQLSNDLDTCSVNYINAFLEGEQAKMDNQDKDKKLKRWQGIGIGSILTAIVTILIKII
jgi:hypothetical protein